MAKLKGEFVWHAHKNEDELFHIIKGTLHMPFRNRIEVMNEDEIIIVPKGVEHCPITKNNEDIQVLLFEKLTTNHTGKVETELTQTFYSKIKSPNK